jgi:hypothetical protein
VGGLQKSSLMVPSYSQREKRSPDVLLYSRVATGNNNVCFYISKVWKKGF